MRREIVFSSDLDLTLILIIYKFTLSQNKQLTVTFMITEASISTTKALFLKYGKRSLAEKTGFLFTAQVPKNSAAFQMFL